MNSFDLIRAAFPNLGVGVYAMDPGGPVTVEVYDPSGQTFSWEGPTLQAALDAAFGPAPAEPPQDPPPAVVETPSNVFD